MHFFFHYLKVHRYLTTAKMHVLICYLDEKIVREGLQPNSLKGSCFCLSWENGRINKLEIITEVLNIK